MKRRSVGPRPTDAELELLQVLWERGPSTVRQVHEAVVARRRVAYTTTLKLLQIMASKGLVTRESQSRAHVYEARPSRREVQGQLVGHLLEGAFGGSAASLAAHALGSRRSSPEELEEIRRLLDQQLAARKK